MKDRKRLFKYFLAYVFTIFSAVFAVIIYLKYFPVESKVITEKKTVNETKLSETAIEDAIDKASITLGVNQRHSNSQININNENNQATQNNIAIDWE